MIKDNIYQMVSSILHKMGFHLSRFPSGGMRRLLNYLNRNDVNICLDVGANIGQYAQMLRSSGFRGRILSFEPQSKAFTSLKKRSRTDAQWQAFNLGFGELDQELEMNISKNSASSSILSFEKNNLSVRVAPETDFIAKEQVQIKRLDTFMKRVNMEGRIFLKIDAQGFESRILDGLGDYWHQVYALQLELSFVPLYQGEKLFDDMKDFVTARGFFLSSLESGFSDFETGRLLQADALFLRDLSTS